MGHRTSGEVSFGTVWGGNGAAGRLAWECSAGDGTEPAPRAALAEWAQARGPPLPSLGASRPGCGRQLESSPSLLRRKRTPLRVSSPRPRRGLGQSTRPWGGDKEGGLASTHLRAGVARHVS